MIHTHNFPQGSSQVSLILGPSKDPLLPIYMFFLEGIPYGLAKGMTFSWGFQVERGEVESLGTLKVQGVSYKVGHRGSKE